MRWTRVPRNLNPDSLMGFAEDAPFDQNMYDRFQGRYLDPYRAPIMQVPDWSYDNYGKLKPIPLKKGKARAKPIPLKPEDRQLPKKRSEYLAALQAFLNLTRRG